MKASPSAPTALGRTWRCSAAARQACELPLLGLHTQEPLVGKSGGDLLAMGRRLATIGGGPRNGRRTAAMSWRSCGGTRLCFEAWGGPSRTTARGTTETSCCGRSSRRNKIRRRNDLAILASLAAATQHCHLGQGGDCTDAVLRRAHRRRSHRRSLVGPVRLDGSICRCCRA